MLLYVCTYTHSSHYKEMLLLTETFVWRGESLWMTKSFLQWVYIDSVSLTAVNRFATENLFFKVTKALEVTFRSAVLIFLILMPCCVLPASLSHLRVFQLQDNVGKFPLVHTYRTYQLFCWVSALAWLS